MLQGFKPRLYQETILATASLKNTLVVLPTGMGKTGIALLLAAQRLQQYPKSKVVVLAPTKPLVEQHMQTFVDHLMIPEKQMIVFTGTVAPARRAELWDNAKIIFSTPQVIENDVICNRIDLEKVSMVVFDEAHRATGEYSYVFVSKQYQKRASWPRVLALTASPGSELEKVEEVCRNLFVESVEVRTEKDADVQPYVQKVDVEYVKVKLPDGFLKMKILLENCKKAKIGDLRQLGLKIEGYVNKRELLRLQGLLQQRMAAGERDYDVLRGMSLLAEIVKVDHALELIETQELSSANKYMQGLFRDASTTKVRAVKNLVANPNFKAAFALVSSATESDAEHPKITQVREMIAKRVQETQQSRIILFTQFRDTASKLHEVLKCIPGVFPAVFVGQAKKNGTGLSQKQQQEIIDLFRDGAVNVLIATSVAEEGLDIPSVDVVMFYEPIPSAIRAIQRRGRTGRLERGKLVVLVTEKTRDEGYLWSSKAKEKKMVSVLEKLKGELQMKFSSSQPTLQSFDAGVKVFADHREKSTGVIKRLVDQNVDVKLDVLHCADYVLSTRVGVELKTIPDFVASIIDGRLLDQLKSLKRNFERPVIILQGMEDVYTVRNVHPNAIRGMLATISVSYGIPIVRTKDDADTAELLITMAKREQSEPNREFSLHADRKPMSKKEQQEYIVSALPSVGPALAKVLLKEFGSVHAVFNASQKELQSVSGVGEKIASSIRRSITNKYQ